MQTQSIPHINSFMYNTSNYESQINNYVSPKDYYIKQEKRQQKRVSKKKIMLGRPTNKKQKMSEKELKALSRQIPIKSELKSRKLVDDHIIMMSRNLRQNLFKAKSKMMDTLKTSNKLLYEQFNVDEDEGEVEECYMQLKLVTNESGSVSVVSSTYDTMDDSASTAALTSSNSSVSYDDEDDLYTPSLNEPIMNMELFFPSFWQPKTMPSYHQSDVTEDQINQWLQRGGFGDHHMSPITMATDQELADLLDFDM